MIRHKSVHSQPRKTTINPRTPFVANSLPAKDNNPEFYTKLYDGSSDPTLILRPTLEIDYANTAANKFFNFSIHHSKGRFFKDCVTADSLHKVNAAVKQARREVSQFRLELEAIDGHRQRVPMEVTIFPLLDGKQVSGFHVTLRDVSQERQIEELVRESQKMEALQYFVSGTAKELQYPLLAILKRIEIIQGKYRGRSFEYVSFKEFTHIMDFFEVMHKQIKTCYDTTAKLGNLNRKRLKFESHHCQANTVIREITRLKEQSFLNSNIILKLKLTEGLAEVGFGELELSQVINNLIDNAIYAMPAGGHLTVSTGLVGDSHQVRIDISDDGVGISPEDLPHIFEPFFTTKHRAADRSTGLGLSIVYSLIKSGHGQIHVKSSLRKGTTVQLLLPVDLPSKEHRPPKK